MRLSVPWAAALLAAAIASVGLIGSDPLWLVPLGHLVAHGHLPSSIPFAIAPTHGQNGARTDRVEARQVHLAWQCRADATADARSDRA